MKDKNQIKLAIETLIAEGRKSFCDDYTPTRAQCIGMALVSEIDHDLLEISATALEDWNHHTEAAILRAMEKGKFVYHEESKMVTIDLEK